MTSYEEVEKAYLSKIIDLDPSDDKVYAATNALLTLSKARPEPVIVPPTPPELTWYQRIGKALEDNAATLMAVAGTVVSTIYIVKKEKDPEHPFSFKTPRLP